MIFRQHLGYILTLLLLVVLIQLIMPSLPLCYSQDLDAYGKVVYVVDGDTIDVYVIEVLDSEFIDFKGKIIRVRLADINAPELYTPKGKIAKEVLYHLVHGKYVYLDLSGYR